MSAEVDYRTSAHPVLRRTFVAHNFGWLITALLLAALLVPVSLQPITSAESVALAVLASIPFAALALLVFSRLRLDVELDAGEVRLRARRALRRPVQTVVARGDFRGFELIDVPDGRRARVAVRLGKGSSLETRDALEIRRDRVERVVREMNDWVRSV